MVFVTKEQRVHTKMSAEMHNYQSTLSGNQSTFSGMGTTFLGLNLKKSAFLVIWSSFEVPSVVSRSSLGGIRQGIRERKETAILIKVLLPILIHLSVVPTLYGTTL